MHELTRSAPLTLNATHAPCVQRMPAIADDDILPDMGRMTARLRQPFKHELLVACESRRVSADGNTVTQEAHDEIASTVRAKEEACSKTGAQAAESIAPARLRSRRR